jgi:hypothetical protein
MLLPHDGVELHGGEDAVRHQQQEVHFQQVLEKRQEFFPWLQMITLAPSTREAENCRKSPKNNSICPQFLRD